ncbi:phosphate ABC transporter permease PstA [Pseudolysinimonas sp.]
MTALATKQAPNALAAGKLPRWAPWVGIGIALAVSFALFTVMFLANPTGDFPVAGAVIVGALLYVIGIVTMSALVEGRRKAVDRFVTSLVIGAFLIAMVPLISVTITVVANGVNRFDLDFFTTSMRNVQGEGGGALHAIIGTVFITLTAAVISIPIGLMTSIYLVEYGKGALARGITFFVDVMTGIPSIVAGLFAYALFAILLGPGTKLGIAGAIALSVLMIPVVVRSSEEMLRIVPNELREASYALGVPKWLTIVKVVLPTSIAGIMTGVMIAIARVIGETAPLLVAAGFTASMNYNLFSGPMNSLPLFVYTQYVQQGNPLFAYIDRAWAGALTLILIVMVLNVLARVFSRIFAPKLGR